MPIYTITLLARELTQHTRCIGYKESLDDACNSVEINEGEMHEALYSHVVIEEHEPRLWSGGKQVAWYEWDKSSYSWKRIPNPDFATNVSGYGMG